MLSITVDGGLYPGPVRIKHDCRARRFDSEVSDTLLIAGDIGDIISVQYSGGLGGFYAVVQMADGRKVTGVLCANIELIKK